MTDYSGRLRLAFQIIDENPDTWGSVLNLSALQLIEDSISGSIDVDVTSSSQTLTQSDGSNDTARYAVLNVIGAPGGARNVIVPEGTDGGGTAPVVDVSKLYFVIDSTTGGEVITVKTSSGTGVAMTPGTAQWMFSDGTDVVDASFALNAGTAASATLAVDSDALGGIAAADYVQRASDNAFSGSQTSDRVILADNASVQIDSSLSNKFFLEPLQNFTLANPTSPLDGKTISIVFQQGAGGPYTISYGAAWAFQGGVQPALTTTVGRYDILGAEFDSDSGTWMGGMIKDMRNS